MDSESDGPVAAGSFPELTPKQARTVELYVAGSPDTLGSKVNSYTAAYNWQGGRAGARSKASALFRRPEVAEYVRTLRAAASQTATATLRDWAELAGDAQQTLHLAAVGKLPRNLSDEAVRSAVRAASYIVDRAYGTPSQQIELRQTGGIVVHVAGPETLGRLVELGDGHQELDTAGARRLRPGGDEQLDAEQGGPDAEGEETETERRRARRGPLPSSSPSP